MTDQEQPSPIVPPFLGADYQKVRSLLLDAAWFAEEGAEESTPEKLQRAIAQAMNALMDADFALKLAVKNEERSNGQATG